MEKTLSNQLDKAQVRYSGELSETDKEVLTSKIRQKFNTTDVSFINDETLIAGIRIEYKDFMYEDSVRARIQQINRD